MARLLSVNVGLPRDIEWKGRTVHTGIWKNPVRSRCRVDRLNLDGDGQGDLAGHGGEQRAVFVYQMESYRYWQEQLKRTDFVHGQFGENFTIEGLPDNAVSSATVIRSAARCSRSLSLELLAIGSASG
jgi:MOSC domain-containing protein YiiM